MPATITIPGLIAVRVKSAGAQQYSFLGYCRDGVQVREHVRIRPIYGDEGGGPDGIPIDYSYLGEMHEVRLELYKWDPATLTLVCQRIPNANKKRDEIWDPGYLMRASNDYYMLQLQSEWRFVQGGGGFNRIYHVALPLSSIEYPLGPREMLVTLEWTCIPDSTGKLFTVPS